MLTDAESVKFQAQGEKKVLESGSWRWKADVLMYGVALVSDSRS